ncbi:YbaB/EbfC family nucleoid-associated protein [Mycobacterium sp. E2462]|uniref:YbaB/EbfC family nucleoid-associated protein n=1 Tax=Mycobacterium sp. E2462 TaxID=1834133 RepID=UPI0009ECE965|nr:YbaB/EbfC family nucleoid-associated protein [Mycobacterium sp. E2462]
MTGGLADSLLARIAKQRDLIDALDEHCRSITVRATSRDKAVSVEVDGLGAMTGLWLSDFAYRVGADTLAQLIVDTAHAAAAKAAERQRYLLGEFSQRMTALEQAPLVRHDGSAFQPGPRRSRIDAKEATTRPTRGKSPGAVPGG